MNESQLRAYQALQLGPVWLPRTGASRSASVDIAPAAEAPAVCTPAVYVVPLSAEPASDNLDWEQLQAAVRDCTKCGLCQSRKQTVFGVGRRNARLLIIGEAPGQQEDAQGEPFVGQAGRLLDAMLATIGMDRAEHVFIANVLKCRPPGNRNPQPAEVASCEPYLRRQVQLLAPSLILLMGRFAAQSILNTDASIVSLRGRLHSYANEGSQIPVIVTYHPAYLLRNLPDKAKAWSDLLFVRRTLAA